MTSKPRNFTHFLIENEIIFPSSILFYPFNIDLIQVKDGGNLLPKTSIYHYKELGELAGIQIIFKKRTQIIMKRDDIMYLTHS